jgi:hypothetical protein
MLSADYIAMEGRLAHVLSFLLNTFGVISLFIAAACWFRASAILGPAEIRVPVGYGVSPRLDTAPLNAFIRETGRLNRIAAKWSGAAAVSVGLGMAINQLHA